MLDVEVITEDQGFDQLEPIWNKLLQSSEADTLFLTFQWLRTWWRYYGQPLDLCILLFSDGDKPVGIAPFCKRKVSFAEIEREMTGSPRLILPGNRLGGLMEVTELGFLGTGLVCSDFLDVFAEKGRESEVADRLVDFCLNTLQDWDLMNLTDVPEHSPVMVRMHQKFAGTRRYRLRFRFNSYFAPLNDDYEAYLMTLSRKSRYNARKKLKEIRLRHKDVDFEYFTDPDGLEEAMYRFIRLHQIRWNQEGQTGVFTTNTFVAFHQEVARRCLKEGWLRLGFLSIDQEPVAGLYSYQYNNRLYLYQQGSTAKYRSYNLGYASLALALKDASDNNISAYDFLRGDASYKLHWAKYARALMHVQVFAHTTRGRLFRLHSRINTSTRLRKMMKRLYLSRKSG